MMHIRKPQVCSPASLVEAMILPETRKVIPLLLLIHFMILTESEYKNRRLVRDCA